MVVRDGSRALWRGLPPTLWRDVPFSAIYWMGYEECKKAIELNHKYNMNELQVSFVAGALSGMVRLMPSAFLLMNAINTIIVHCSLQQQ